MAIPGMLQQQPLPNYASVRVAPSPQHGAHLNIRNGHAQISSVPAAVAGEEKSFKPALDR